MIDWKFIGSLEGQSILRGYVPSYSASGVTIATGVDLGQRSAGEIAQLPISDELKAKLSPYAGRKGLNASQFCAHNPLTITQAESDSLDIAVRQGVVAVFRSNYDIAIAHRSNSQRFDQLCDPRQTVLASVGYQYGPNCRAIIPDFWDTAVSQDWNGLVLLLRNFDDAFPVRRNKEADYLVSHACQ